MVKESWAQFAREGRRRSGFLLSLFPSLYCLFFSFSLLNKSCTVPGSLLPQGGVSVGKGLGALDLVFIAQLWGSLWSGFVEKFAVEHYYGKPEWFHSLDVSCPAETVVNNGGFDAGY